MLLQRLHFLRRLIPNVIIYKLKEELNIQLALLILDLRFWI